LKATENKRKKTQESVLTNTNPYTNLDHSSAACPTNITMPTIRNTIIHELAVDPTTESTSTSNEAAGTTTTANWPLIELVLLLVLLTVLTGAILVQSLCACSSNRQQRPGPAQGRQRQNLRNGLHGTILLIGLVLSIIAHFSCNTLRLEESPSAELQAIGIWKVWHEQYKVCLDANKVGFSSPTSGSGTRALAVSATLFGATSLLFLYGSTQSSGQCYGPGKVKAMAMLSGVCGFVAACLQGGALATLRQSDACDDYVCSNNFETAGAMWPILAILYWIAGLVVTLYFTVVVPVVPVAEEEDNDNNVEKGESASVTTDASGQAASHSEMEDRSDGTGDCRRRSILSTNNEARK
jgi:hypothetical protein